LGALASTLLFRWLVPNLNREAKNILVAQDTPAGVAVAGDTAP
jgi:hypothetical protein